MLDALLVSVGSLQIPLTISGYAQNLERQSLIVYIAEDCCSLRSIFPIFVLAWVILLLCTISKYLPISSMSLVCSKEMALHWLNKKLFVVIAGNPCISRVGSNFNEKNPWSAELMSVIARWSLSWTLF